jgi:pimeloyl-ACP methyl ester carboxylesterase
MSTNKPTYLFLHANGFPAKSYLHFWECLGIAPEYINTIGNTEFGVGPAWTGLAREVSDWISTKKNIIAIGHSVGAWSLYLAAKTNPSHFQTLILLEPPLITAGWPGTVLSLISKFGIHKKINPTKSALNRRARFSSLHEARHLYLQKPFFKNLNPICFDDYMKAAFIEDRNQKGVELLISPKTEAEIFSNIPTHIKDFEFSFPVHLLYGSSSSVVTYSVARRIEKALRTIKTHKVKGGHMFPLEKPVETSNYIKNILAR